MPDKPTQQEETSNAMKKQIISIANELFHSKSYDEVSMRDIAACAGVTTGALYHHFENKQAILVEAFRNEFSEKNLLSVCENCNDPEGGLIRFICHDMPDIVLKDGKDITRTRVFYISNFDRKTVLDVCVSALLKKGVNKGVFSAEYSLDEMTDFICSVYRSSVYQFCASTEQLDLKELLTRRMRFALLAIKTRP